MGKDEPADEEGLSAVMDRAFSQTAYSSQSEAFQLAEYLLHSPTERRSRLKALPQEAQAYVLEQLAEKGKSRLV